MLEDYFFAQTADGRGSKVDTLPGGENLGQIDDLRYFNNKLLRGLRIPSSYLPTGPDDGSAIYNDGKVGVAYIQEYKFSKYVERLQKQIQEDIDREFKLYLKYRGIEIDSGNFDVQFTKPLNFSSYRDLQIETERAQLFQQVQAIPFLSNQFKLKKYLGLSEEEIRENETLWRQENDYQKFDTTDSFNAGLSNIGIRPEPNDAVDPEADADLTDLPAPDADPAAPLPDTGTTPPVGGEPV